MREYTPRISPPPEPPEEHWPSDEDLAAYIDGNLDQAESKQIVEHLASCEDCYAVYIGAVRFKLETDPAPVDNVVRFPSREETRRGWRLSAMAAAAVLLIATAGGGYYLAGPLPALMTDQVAEPIQGKPEQMGNLWRGPTLRGAGGAEEEVPLDPAAFQIGVQLVNLQVSLKANQGEQAQDVVARILHNLDKQMFVDGLKDGYKGITVDIANGTPPKNLTGKASELAGQAREVFTPLYLDLGQWVEAGRLASISHDPAFFRLPESRSFLRHALWHDRLGFKNSKLPEKSRMELYEIGRILDKGAPQPGDYSKLQIHFDKILATEYPE